MRTDTRTDTRTGTSTRTRAGVSATASGRSLARALRLLGSEALGGVWPLAAVIAAWEAAYLLLPRNSLLRAPGDVASFLTHGSHARQLLSAMSSTFLILLLGYAIAIAVSVLLAAAMVSSRVLSRAIMPLAVVIGVLPVIVVAPVIILLVGRNPVTSVTVCVVITFLPALLNVIAGMRSTSRSLLDLCHVLGGGPLATLVSVRLPQAVPGILSASKLALPAALTGVILTEYIATGRGIGTYINQARADFRYVDMWAGIMTVMVMSVVAYTLLGVAEILLSERYVATGRRDARKAR